MNGPMDFSTAPTQQMGSGELLPKGYLSWGVLEIRPHNLDMGMIETPSKTSDGAYLDCIITLEGGPHDKRKIFHKIGVKGSEQYVQGGHAAIRHILETGRNANPANAAGYRINSFYDLNGLRVAFEVTLKKGKDGYEDKNGARFLSPNPESDTHKKYERLLKGGVMPKNATAAPAAAAPAAPPAWTAPAASAVPPAPTAPATPAAPPPAQQGATARPAWLPGAPAR